MAQECVFCRIIAGELPADFVYRGRGVVGFRDIHPVADTHVLVVPEIHIQDLRDLGEEHAGLWLTLAQVANQVARELGHADGYRFYVSVGAAGGQTVPHLHVHVLGGAMRRIPV